MYFVFFSFSIIHGGTLYTQGGHCPQNAHEARPKSTFLGYVFVMSWLTVNFLQRGQFSSGGQVLRMHFYLYQQSKWKGHHHHGYWQYRSEYRTNIHCYQLTNHSIYRKNILGFWLQFTDEDPKSSGQQPVQDIYT